MHGLSRRKHAKKKLKGRGQGFVDGTLRNCDCDATAEVEPKWQGGTRCYLDQGGVWFLAEREREREREIKASWAYGLLQTYIQRRSGRQGRQAGIRWAERRGGKGKRCREG